ncbi:hypothetical protein N9X88_03720 [Alphaproteobacteria bacterium]|nr:hypothetical protein [Alphaproteobacteria bacterium]MDB2523157.1 hypothetical protein [Alphaproteobacteria bacterium]
MNKNKNAMAWRRRRGLVPILLAFIVTLLLGLALTGCTKLEVTPPDYELRLSESKQLQQPFNRVWARAIGWFDANELELERIDERTGYIEGKLAMTTNSPFMDCGKVATRNVVGKPALTQQGRVRMQVSGQNGPNATVTIYMSGTYRLSVFDRYAGREVYRSGPCVSNGQLEKRIFAFLDS